MPPVGFRKQVELAMPGTFGELVGKTGLSQSTIKKWLAVIRADGASHIGKWIRTEGRGGSFRPVHVLGPGRDARCNLKRMDGAECSRRYRKALAKASKEGDPRLDRRRAVASAKWFARKAAKGKSVDPLVAALFGTRVKPQETENP